MSLFFAWQSWRWLRTPSYRALRVVWNPPFSTEDDVVAWSFGGRDGDPQTSAPLTYSGLCRVRLVTSDLPSAATYYPRKAITGDDTDTRRVELWLLADSPFQPDVTGDDTLLGSFEFDGGDDFDAGDEVDIPLSLPESDPPYYLALRSVAVGDGAFDPGGEFAVFS